MYKWAWIYGCVMGGYMSVYVCGWIPECMCLGLGIGVYVWGWIYGCMYVQAGL